MIERYTSEGRRAEAMLRKLAMRGFACVPEYAQIKALETVGFATRGKERGNGIFNYRISPAGRAWLAEHPEGT